MSEAWDENDTWKNEEEEEETRPRTTRRRRAPRNEKQSNLYLLTGLVIGMILGLVYSWLISPVRYTDTEPSSLAASYKDEYRMVIALAYNANHNLGRARERLALLQAGDPVQILAAQAQRMLAANQSPQEARALALLAADLGRPQNASAQAAASNTEVSAVVITEEATPTETKVDEPTPLASTAAQDTPSAIQTPTPPLPTLTPTVTATIPAQPTPTFAPTPTPTRALDMPFKLVTKREVCGTSSTPGLLQIQINKADNQPLPGVPVLITWQNGEETFFTGLKPEINPGYADFQMSAGINYNLRVGQVNDPVKNLTIPSCGGGMKLEFQELTSR